MSRIQRENHRIGSNEIKKIYFSFFDGKIHILNNGTDALARGC